MFTGHSKVFSDLAYFSEEGVLQLGEVKLVEC